MLNLLSLFSTESAHRLSLLTFTKMSSYQPYKVRLWRPIKRSPRSTMDEHVVNATVAQPNTNALAGKPANTADYLRLLVESLQQTPERHGPIHHFPFGSEKRSFLADSEVWVDDGEECFICKEPLTNQSAPCIGEPAPQSDGKPRVCSPLCLWPCDHIVGDRCFELCMSNAVNAEAGLCPFCR